MIAATLSRSTKSRQQKDDRAVVQTGERIKKITSPQNQDSMVNELLVINSVLDLILTCSK